MANVDPKMGLLIPVPTQEPGPDYAEQMSDNMTKIAGHTHLGDGLTGDQLSQDSLDISGDLSLNQTNNLTNVRGVIFTDQTVAPDGVGDVRIIYFLDGDLYINDGTGAVVRLTEGGAINVTSANTIYSPQAVSSNWTIVSTDTYVLLQVNTTASRIVTLPSAASVADGRYYIIADVTGNAQTHPITINKSGSDTIDGASSHLLTAAFGAVVVMSDGISDWKAVDQFNSQQGTITLGSSPARTGALALSSAQGIKSRNAAGSSDLNVIGTDGSDNLSLGDAGNPKLSVGPGSVGFVAAATPVISQDIASSGAGKALTVQAQAAASGTNAGGDVILKGGARGNGSAVYGGIQLQTGDGTNQLDIHTAAIKANNIIQTQGSNVAHSGDIAMKNNGFIAFRNNANGGDILGLFVDSSDAINIGEATNTKGIQFSQASGSANFSIASTSALSIATSGITTPAVDTSLIEFISTATPSIDQIIRGGTGANNGANFTVVSQSGQAQTGSANNNSGGNLILGTGAAGTGGSGSAGVPGSIIQKLGGQTVLTMSSVGGAGITTLLDASQNFSIFQGSSSQSWYFISGVVNFESSTTTMYDFSVNKVFDFNNNGAGASNFTVAAPVTYTFTQAQKAGTGATAGLPLTIQAQQGQAQTGATANNNGGNLLLTSGAAGTGGSGAAGSNGTINFELGGSNVIKLSDVGLSGNAAFVLDASKTFFFFQANGAGQGFVLQATGGSMYMDSPTINVRDNSNAQVLTLTQSGAGASSLVVASTVTSYAISQSTKASGTGAPFSIAAQATSSGTGGALALTSGLGSTASGAASLGTGSGNSTLTLNESAVSLTTSGNTVFSTTASATTVRASSTIDLNIGGTNILALTSTAGTLDSSLASFTFSQTTRPSTGTNAGAAFNITAQAGQAQTGIVANNNGGNLVLSSGAAGTGGSGAAAVSGFAALFAGAGTSTGVVLHDNNAGIYCNSGNITLTSTTTILTLGGAAPPVLAPTAISATTGTTTLSGAQLQNLLINYSASLTGNVILDFSNLVGFRFVDIRLVTLNAHTISAKNGTTTVAFPTATTSKNIFMVSTDGSNGLSIG